MFNRALIAGAMIGNAVALPVSGVLSAYGFSEGWDSVFYVIGQCSLIAFYCVFQEIRWQEIRWNCN